MCIGFLVGHDWDGSRSKYSPEAHYCLETLDELYIDIWFQNFPYSAFRTSNLFMAGVFIQNEKEKKGIGLSNYSNMSIFSGI